jgi:hypothetical protein
MSTHCGLSLGVILVVSIKEMMGILPPCSVPKNILLKYMSLGNGEFQHIAPAMNLVSQRKHFS